MSHTDIIWIVATATFASTFGVYVAIKLVNKYTRLPVNTLQSRGDIELDYIEPARPEQIYNSLDLLERQPMQWYIYERAPSYHTEIQPWYPSRGVSINSCLENENIFNSYFIFLIIMFLVIIFWKINSRYSMLLMIPFSIFDIDFRDSFEWELNSYRVKPMISYLKLQSLTKDINLLLLSLLDDVNYSMSLSFIPSYKKWEEKKNKVHPLFIDDAIIINKESDPILITQFIMENLDKKGYFISDWLFKDESLNSMDPVILTVIVAIKVKI